MIFDAIVLAGGRSSRLGGVPKALLQFKGETLAGLTLDAALDARQRVIVGDHAALAAALGDRAVVFARENPPFAGPPAAVAAGLDALGGGPEASGGAATGAGPAAAGPTASEPAAAEPAASGPADFVLVLACDMPRVAEAVAALLAAAQEVVVARKAAAAAGGAAAPTGPAAAGTADGFVARSSDGRPQPLVGLYRTEALAHAAGQHRVAGDLENLSIRSLLGGLQTVPVDVPTGSTDDIDTADDARRAGIGLP